MAKTLEVALWGRFLVVFPLARLLDMVAAGSGPARHHITVTRAFMFRMREVMSANAAPLCCRTPAVTRAQACEELSRCGSSTVASPTGTGR